MDENFFSEEDLAGLFEELDAVNADVEEEEDPEMEASERRFQEIIKKHRQE